jgi:DNA-binding NtrC family response regulator
MKGSAKPHVLIVDDEPNVRRVLATLLEQGGYATSRAESGEQALALVRTQDPDLVLTDLRMGEIDGLELLGRIKHDFPEIPVVLVTAHGTVATAVEAMKRGAFDFVTKPFDRDGVLDVVVRALGQAERLRREFQGPLVPGARCGLVGSSVPMERLARAIEKVAATPATVLIQGETGTGKELVAEALHQLSARARAPLIKINCGALPETLVESELFGHERGAFTGAERERPGRFELADGGTLFLDEIGELPLAIQPKLLRVVEDGRIERVGATATRTVDVRLVAATHRDLAGEARAGRFREDLRYRLDVIRLDVPPLRERLADVPALVDCFLDKHARRLGRPRPSIEPEALAALAARPWPGNVRELENAVERAMLLADSERLGVDDFTAAGTGTHAEAPAEPPVGTETGSIKDAARAAAARAERRMILAALAATGHNVTRAAERLGLSRRGLQLKLKELGLP